MRLWDHPRRLNWAEGHVYYCMQVKRHHDKLQAEKEAAGIAKLQSSLPKVAKPVLAYALQDSQLDAEKALLVLRQFQSETFDELNDIQQRRKHLRSYGSNGHRHSKRSASASPGSGDDSDSSEGRRHRHEKSRKHKHKKSSKHGSDKRKDRHKKHKKEKRSKRSRQSPPPHEDDGGPGTHGRPLEFGSFGVLREADYTSKRPEFAAWASEIKRIDIESLPRWATPLLNYCFMTCIHLRARQADSLSCVCIMHRLHHQMVLLGTPKHHSNSVWRQLTAAVSAP